MVNYNDRKLNISQAFDDTINKFKISAKSISKLSGVSEKMISMFRNGRQRINSDSLQDLLEALPTEAKLYFLIQLSDGKLADRDRFTQVDYVSAEWKSLISSASLADIEIILRALADRHSEIKESKRHRSQSKEEIMALSA